MGVTTEREKIPFTRKHLLDRQLVISMLKDEEVFAKSTPGQDLYRQEMHGGVANFDVMRAIHRRILDKYDFDDSSESVEIYRDIFRTYYNSPKDYDEEVINSVHYMRENKCIKYTDPPMKIGQKIPNCDLTDLNGKTTNLHHIIREEKCDFVVFASYSES